MIISGKDKTLLYLGKQLEIEGFIIKSPYVACLMDAREATERYSNNGEKKEGRHASWLGAVAYLILIDHIGGKFEINDLIKKERLKKIGRKDDFVRTLIFFSNLKDEEILTLYALRCSFVHDYFLFNKNTDKRLNHRFSVTVGNSGNIVSLPQKVWDRNLESEKEENKTTVNLELVGDLVEEIHKKLICYAEKNELIVRKDTELGFLRYLKQ